MNMVGCADSTAAPSDQKCALAFSCMSQYITNNDYSLLKLPVCRTWVCLTMSQSAQTQIGVIIVFELLRYTGMGILNEEHMLR